MAFIAVGRRIPRLDGPAKVSGRATYTGDMRLPGMLFGGVLRSPYSHATVVDVRCQRALKHGGVVAVLTPDTVPDVSFNTACVPPSGLFAHANDQRALERRVRYVGDRVAAVAAVDKSALKEALDLIEVDYEERPAIFDPEEAMRPGAPLLHDSEGNIAAYIPMGWGDVEEGFRGADLVVEDRYTVPAVQHCALEPHVCICQYDLEGRLTVWSSTQTPFHLRRMLGEVLGLSLSRIRVIQPYDGGGFGGKQEMVEEPLCALLARATGRPVMMEYSRGEEFSASRTRHSAVFYIRSGVKRDGTFTAREMKAIVNTGAYASHGPAVTAVMGVVFGGLYKTSHMKYEGHCVYTNLPVAGAFRGYGSPQVHFAVESQVDRIAAELGMDPIQFRLKNALMKGDVVPATGWAIESCGLEECMERGAAAIGWSRRGSGRSGKVRRGIGMARLFQPTGTKPFVPEHSSAVVKVNEDGTVTVVTGASDSGTGSNTALAQIAAEELGVEPQQVQVVAGDTDFTPFDMGSYASRSTFVAGGAVRQAAADARQRLLAGAAQILEARVDDLEIASGEIFVRGSPDVSVSIEKVAGSIHYSGEEMGAIVGRAAFEPGSNSPSFGAHFAEVEVDTESGRVRVIRYVAAHDVGRAINPMAVEGQIEGGLAQGLGYALSEEMVLRSGRMENPTFCDYKLPTTMDVPEVTVLLVEEPTSFGPFGAKGVGEAGIVPVAPAISNAIFDAVGVQVRELPVTPERMLFALKGADGWGKSSPTLRRGGGRPRHR